MDKLQLCSIVGARPNFVKLAALSPEIRKVANETIIHTGQHYDYEMSKSFFDEMNIPEPDLHLGIGSGTHGYQTGMMMASLDRVLDDKPDGVIVYGDTNSTLAGALSAVKMHIPIIHIESGERSFDRKMPEEINRVIVDHVSDVLFSSTFVGYHNLKNEGVEESKIHVCGDVMVDLMQKFGSIPVEGIPFDRFNVLTIHREENATLETVLTILNTLKDTGLNFVLPEHPRITKLGLTYPENIFVMKPVGYLHMRWLEEHADRIVTDSGGVQKEAYLLKKPCITLRETTEWIETLDGGWNILAGTDADVITKAFKLNPIPSRYREDLFGRHKISRSIARVMIDDLTEMQHG